MPTQNVASTHSEAHESASRPCVHREDWPAQQSLARYVSKPFISAVPVSSVEREKVTDQCFPEHAMMSCLDAQKSQESRSQFSDDLCTRPIATVLCTYEELRLYSSSDQ